MKYSFSVIKNKKVLLILIIIIILFTKIVITFRNNEPFTKKDYHKIHMNLLSALERIQRVFNSHGIKYWATFGTLLGSIREGKIIDYDDDIDLGVLKEDYYRILNDPSIQKDLEIEKVHVYRRLNLIRVVLYKSDEKYINNNIFIDIFPFDKKGNYIFQYFFNHRLIEPNHYYYDHELFPLKKWKLNNLEIMGPNDPIKYLERGYGDCSDKNKCWKKKIKASQFEQILHRKEINLQ